MMVLSPYQYAKETSQYGHYRITLTSGLITGVGVTANAPLFALRWNPPANKQQGFPSFLLTHFNATLNILTAFGSAQELQLQAFVARSFSANLTGGTQATMTTNNAKCKTLMGTSLLVPGTNGDLRIANATLLGAGTYTNDAQPFSASPSYLSTTIPAPALITDFNLARGEHPIQLAPNEGIILQEAIAFAATGVGRLVVDLSWCEIAAY
jgi:hypothetical protein